MGKSLQKELATSNFNVYSGQSGKLWSEVEEMLQYDSKLSILEIFWADLLKKNHDKPLERHFRVEKTLELLTRKYLST